MIFLEMEMKELARSTWNDTHNIASCRRKKPSRWKSISTYTRTRTCTHAHTQMHACTHACMHSCTHACMHSRTHGRMCARARAHTHTHTHTHTKAIIKKPVKRKQTSQWVQHSHENNMQAALVHFKNSFLLIYDDQLVLSQKQQF